jgi:hypothetical protein
MKKDITKLPKWAQKLIADLKKEIDWWNGSRDKK